MTRLKHLKASSLWKRLATLITSMMNERPQDKRMKDCRAVRADTLIYCMFYKEAPRVYMPSDA